MTTALHFIHLWETPRQYPFSGAENHLLTLLPALRAAGVAVELGALIVREGPVVTRRLARLEADGFPVHRFPLRPVLDPRCLGRLRGFLAGQRASIIHTHLDYADANVKLAARWAGCRRVVTSVHNAEPGHRRPQWFYLLRLLEALTPRYIAISEAVRRHLVEVERVPPAKVQVIPYGLPPAPAGPERASLRQALGLDDRQPVVGFVGRLTPQKNVAWLLRALARLPQVTGLILGDGEDRPALEQAAGALPNVRFLGHREQAADWMRAFDVLCLPSRWEGLGLVLVEAMLRRVPVVAARVGPIPEVLGDGRFGWLCESDDVDGLAAALRAALAAPAALVEAAYQHARTTYALEQMVARTLAVYAELAA